MMKRSLRKLTLCIAFLFCLCSLWTMTSMAASSAPVITMQPQSPNYPEYSVAIYTVKVTGKNLSATWYLQWQGKTYTASKVGGAMQDWEAYAGESYGARKLDDNTFAFIFEGIEYDLDGAYIWCVVEDGHYDVTSQKARISVGNPASPPEILDIPSDFTVEQGEEVEIRCLAKAPEGTQLSYLWYETSTGKMEDIVAVNRGTEDCDFLNCDTSTPGTYNYVCFINTSEGGFANSSFVTVTVIPYADPEPKETEPQPEATEPQVSEPEVTEPITLPTEEETHPTTEPTTLTTPVATVPGEATAEEPAPHPTEPQVNTFPWWAVLLVGFAGVGAGVGITVVLLKKK